jgi:hypothetical protein
MKRLMAAAGVALTISPALLCVVSAVSAEPRDSVDRSQRLDSDAIRDDVRIDRLKVPTHPLSAGPPQQLQPALNSKGKAKPRKTGDLR